MFVPPGEFLFPSPAWRLTEQNHRQPNEQATPDRCHRKNALEGHRTLEGGRYIEPVVTITAKEFVTERMDEEGKRESIINRQSDE
jgi:hypothetical protein